MEKIPTISIPPPKQKIQLEKPLRQESLVKTFHPNKFPKGMNQNEAFGNFLTQVKALRKKWSKGRILVIYH